jgi:hypothetical protein
MRRLALAVVGLCAVVGACDNSRGIADPAIRVPHAANESAAREQVPNGEIVSTLDVESPGVSQKGIVAADTLGMGAQNIGTSGSGH